MAVRRWLPAAGALTAGAALAAVLFLPVAARGPIGNGAAFLFATYAEALAAAGLGVALSQLPRRPAVSGILLFAAGLFAGWAVKDPILSALVERPGTFEYTGYVGPLACVLSGLALAVPGHRRRLMALAVAAPVGAAIGFIAALNDPTLGESQFFTGAAIAAFWLLLAPLALLPSLDAAYVAIGGRILASWLIAIGLMLGAAKLVPRQQDAQPGESAPALPETHFGAS